MLLKSLSIFILSIFMASIAYAQQALTLEQAIHRAHQNDPWLHGTRLQQKALEQNSEALNALPNPQVNIGMRNLPTDTFHFDQEGMTQLSVGLSQMFPRGDELTIKQAQLVVQSGKFKYLREDRKAKLSSMVSNLWLDAFVAQKTISLINSDRALFEQMAELATANYSSTVGKTRQHDVIRAQLELVQLDERLNQEQQKLELALAQLNEWLYIFDEPTSSINFDASVTLYAVSENLPDIDLIWEDKINKFARSKNDLAKAISTHPMLLAIDVKQEVANKDIELAHQQYKPQWGVYASYAYRDNIPGGTDRADLFSVGVTFDLPWFSTNSQDSKVKASVAQASSIKTEKLLLMKNMLNHIYTQLRQLALLRKRQALYRDHLLTQSDDQVEASLNAYTVDDGDFSEVLSAKLGQLNARISALQINIEVLKTISQIQYYFTGSEHINLLGGLTAPAHSTTDGATINQGAQ